MADKIPPLPRRLVERKTRASLREDWGAKGDITSRAVVGAHDQAAAQLRARRGGILAGMDFAAAAFRLSAGRLSAGRETLRLTRRKADGARLARGDIVMELRGQARALLAGERVALNYLGHLSGIATTSAELASALAGTRAQLRCTRKTTPGLRAEEKYAMRVGGVRNHRATLSDGVLIKDNHIALASNSASDLAALVAAARRRLGARTADHVIEVEIDRLQQIEAALSAGADMLLLDNMTPAQTAAAVRQIGTRAQIEVSGGIATRRQIAAHARAGAHFIATSAPVSASRWLDFGLDFV